MKMKMTHRGAGGLAGVLAAALLSQGCLATGPKSADTSPIAPSVAASVPGAPRGPLMKVTLTPRAREILTISAVTHQAAASGIVLTKTPAVLPVTVAGTANASGEAWLEGSGGAALKTPLRYDAARGLYAADIEVASGSIEPGRYDVRATLRNDRETLEPVTAVEPVRLVAELPAIEPFQAYFETDSAALSDDDVAKITSYAARLAPLAPQIAAIRVEGHCDMRGSELHNTELGTDRAAAVAAILGARLPGVAIGVVSLGSAAPEPAGDGPEDLALNRWARVVVETR